MIKKLTYFLSMFSISFALFAKEEKVVSIPKEGVAWTIYASLKSPSAEFYYSDDYIKEVGGVYEVEVLKNYQQLQYIGEGYGKEYSYMSSIEVQHINCKADSYQSKLVKAFRKSGAKEPAFYSEQTKDDWHSSEGNGGQKYLHRIVCAKDTA
jgi:hypothetical protein